MKRAIYAIPITSLFLSVGCAGVCGDGVLAIGEGEVCDDGNTASGDGCSADCLKIELCGDGLLDVGEACDDGNAAGGDGCRADCQGEELCGDGLVDAAAGEECDDANNNNSDDCLDTCLEASCGDGEVQTGVEACDDANNNNDDGCTNACDLDPIINNFEITTQKDVALDDTSFQVCTYSFYQCYTYTDCTNTFDAPVSINEAFAAAGSYTKTRDCVDDLFDNAYAGTLAISGAATIVTSGAQYQISLTEGAESFNLSCTMNAAADLSCTDNNGDAWQLTAQ